MKKKNKQDFLPSVDLGPEVIVETPKVEPNKQLMRLARKMKLFGYMALVFLAVFIIGMILIFRNDITVENYQYLIRFFTSTESEYNGNYEPIYFDSTGSTNIDIFHSDLAVLKGDSVTLFNMAGNATLNYSLAYSTPTLITSGKYMLTYDLGGNTFDLFNNFSHLTTQTYEYPISNAAISSEGMYAVVTKSLEYQSVVYLYDHNMNLLSKIFKDKYVMGISINDSASEILIVSSYAEDGAYKTEISTYEPFKEKPKSTEILSGCLGIMCSYHSDGSYSVLCSDALRFYNDSNKLVSTFELGSITPSKCEMGDKITTILYNESIVGSTMCAMIFDNNGKLLRTTEVDNKILDLAVINQTSYLLGNGVVYEIKADDGQIRKATIENGATTIFTGDVATLICGYSNMAKPYLVEDLFKKVPTSQTKDEKATQTTAETTKETTTVESTTEPETTQAPVDDSTTNDDAND